MNFTALLRTSTDQQHNSFSSQLEKIEEFVSRYDGTINNVFHEICSGSATERPVLDKAVASCLRDGSFLCVAFVDRLSRSLFVVSKLNQTKGLKIVCAEFGTIENSTMLLNLRCLIAEDERESIRRRIKDTIQTLKLQGRKWGREDFGTKEGKKGITAYQEKIKKHAGTIVPRIKALKLSGICSYSAIARQLNLAGFLSVNGKQFYPATIKSLCLTHNC